MDVMQADGTMIRNVLKRESFNLSEAKWLKDYATAQGEVIPFVKIATVTVASRYFGDPSFSSDGSSLAVVKGVEDRVSTTTCAVGAEGGQECLAESDSGAYIEHRFECICTSQIIEVKSGDGGVIKEITPLEKESQLQTPTYSTGGALAFARSSWSMPGSAIFVARPPDFVPIQLTSGPNDYAPDFSPSGSRIVFSHGERDIALVGVSGGLLTILPLANPPGSYENHVESPVFSPDGFKIAFERSITVPGAKPEQGVYTIETGGSNLTRIIDEGLSPSWQATPVSGCA